MKRRSLIHKILSSVILVIILIVFMIPVYWTFVMSFDETVLSEIPTPPRLLPRVLSTANYDYAFSHADIMRYVLNTGMITTICTFISVATALMCGYAFAKGRFFLKKFWFVFVLAVMMIPFEAIMIPLYIQYTKWGMMGTYLPIILGYFKYPYGIFLSKQNIQSIPDSLREACYIDGGREWRTFLSIIVPLCGPVIATMCILQIIGCWNSFLWPMICIRDRSMYLISIGVQMFNSSETVQLLGPRMALAFISAIPIIIAYLFLQRFIVTSVAVSGIKE